MTEVVDLATGSEDDRDGLPPTEGLRLLTADGTRVIVRPSGTEPKVKCYLEVVVPLDPDADHKAVGRARHDARDPPGRGRGRRAGRRWGSSGSGCS